MKIGHGRWRGRHDQGGDSAKVVDFDRNVGKYESDSDYSPADEFERLDDCDVPQPVHPSASQSVNPDNVHLLTGLPRSGPRSQPCQTPIGNVITHAHSVAKDSSQTSGDAQSPSLSVPTEAI